MDPNMTTSQDKLVINLKGEIKRQGKLKKFNGRCADRATRSLVQSWLLLHSKGVDITSEAWDYIERDDSISTWKKINSKELGIRTMIGPYTDKKGVTKQAHYTHNLKYYGSTHVYGDEPVFYKGYFRINRDEFEVIVDGTELKPSDFFKPKRA